MNYPATVKVGAHTYQLKFLSHWDGSDSELAYTKYENQEIVINSALQDTQKFSVLIHEAMHAMNPEMDHALLASLAEQLCSFLVENNFV